MPDPHWLLPEDDETKQVSRRDDVTTVSMTDWFNQKQLEATLGSWLSSGQLFSQLSDEGRNDAK